MILTREKKEVWNVFEKTSFRFLFLYFLLYVLSIFSATLWEPIIKFIGTELFNINYEFSANGKGSGDTTYAYLLLFLFFWLAIIGSFIWSVIDRKRKSYNQLQYGFLVFIRFIVIFFMFTYGIIKIFHLQMSPVSNADLIKTLGEKSPMGLAWTFMGFSKTYSVFAGLSEALAGLLLVYRRTQTFGAIATIIVMLNVFMMNICFDIPVKIFSFHLMLMGILLLMADFKRVFGVLLFNKNITNYRIYPQLEKEDRKIIMIAKNVMLLLVVGFFVFTSYPRYKRQYVNPKTAFFGVWKVTHFNRNKDTTLTTKNLQKRWKYIAIDRAKYASIKTINDKQATVKFEIDTVSKQIYFGTYSSKITDTLSYKKNKDTLIIDGKIKAKSIYVKLQKKSFDDFLLQSRGFNWINENPLNR